MTQNTSSSNAPTTVIIGAGLSGLVAAGRLAGAGRRVTLVEKARSIGGRLATRQMDGAVLDIGAQFFTTRSPEFTSAVAEWTEAGVTSEWCRGFADDDGYPRYRADGGMNQLARHLASGLDRDLVTVATKSPAQALLQMGDTWGVTYVGGSRDVDEAASIISTAPVPETIDLLVDGVVRLDNGTTLDDLRQITYHRVIALLVRVDGPPDFGTAGALQQPDDPTFSFVSDNMAKDISPVRAVTFHTAHALSAELFDRTDAEIIDALVPEALAVLAKAGITDPAAIGEVQVRKWKYAGPTSPLAERSLTIALDPGPLVLAGDAFGGSKVEGAYLSGLAAADAILAST